MHRGEAGCRRIGALPPVQVALLPRSEVRIDDPNPDGGGTRHGEGECIAWREVEHRVCGQVLPADRGRVARAFPQDVHSNRRGRLEEDLHRAVAPHVVDEVGCVTAARTSGLPIHPDLAHSIPRVGDDVHVEGRATGRSLGLPDPVRLFDPRMAAGIEPPPVALQEPQAGTGRRRRFAELHRDRVVPDHWARDGHARPLRRGGSLPSTCGQLDSVQQDPARPTATLRSFDPHVHQRTVLYEQSIAVLPAQVGTFEDSADLGLLHSNRSG